MVALKVIGELALVLLMLIIGANANAGMSTCCYGNETYESGDLIESFPTKCMQLFCGDGHIETRYYNEPEDCGCCEFNGKMYQDGEKIAAICTDVTCVNGHWESKGCFDECCKKCNLQNDPHITTFDKYRYDWHGICNYSISQPGYGFNEHYGIYGQFRQCQSFASCIDVTTFTDNPTTVIQIPFNSGKNVTVNGDAYVVKKFVEVVNTGSGPHPVLAWREGGCNMFLGSQGYLLMTCENQVSVWAYPNLMPTNGLCGHFNMYQHDDFTDRMEVQHELVKYPYEFPLSWMTNDPPNCLLPNVKSSSGIQGADNPCKADDVELQRLREECQALLQHVKWHCVHSSQSGLDNAIESCVSDLCLMSQNGETQDAIDDWKTEMKMMLKLNVKIEVKTAKDGYCETYSDDNEDCPNSENSENSEHSSCNGNGGCLHPFHLRAKQSINLEFGIRRGRKHGNRNKHGIEIGNGNELGMEIGNGNELGENDGSENV